MSHIASAEPEPAPRHFLSVFRYSRRALGLVWSTNRPLTVSLAVLTLVAGVLPAAMAYVGALIIDAVVAAATVANISGNTDLTKVYGLIAMEAVIVAALAGAQRGINLCQSLLRAQLGQRPDVERRRILPARPGSVSGDRLCGSRTSNNPVRAKGACLRLRVLPAPLSTSGS